MGEAREASGSLLVVGEASEALGLPLVLKEAMEAARLLLLIDVGGEGGQGGLKITASDGRG